MYGGSILTNQQYEERQSHPEVLIDRMAHSLGFYAARTYLRIQSMARPAHEGANQQDQLKREQTETADQPAQSPEQAEELSQSRTRKAEEMVDYLAQHLSSLTATVKLNFQRTTARVREDTEDMWAEAQDIRHHRGHPLPK
jgi:hypothetical protein